MPILKVLLYSILNTQRIDYNDTHGAMIAEIEGTYFHKCKVLNYMNGGARIKVCSETRKALQDLEKKYDNATNRHIRKLNGFLAKLSDGDCFYYFNEEKTSVVERKTAIACLKAMKKGFPWTAKIHNWAFHYYSMMNIYFTYLSFGYDGIKEFAGEEDKTKRVCRFCGKKRPEVTFNKIAHAIQEALGNKLLFCHEECDSCNHDLALTEDNLRYLMDFRRAIFHIARKGSTKAPTVVGKNFIVKADRKGNPVLYLMEESLPDQEKRNQPFMMRLKLKSGINNERMYKALCKMVIDMLPSIELSHFANTIQWIKSKGDWTPDTLPSVLLTIVSNNHFKEQPVLDIYINNRQHKLETPYCTAIIWLYDIAYMFIMPFADVDLGKFKYDKNLQTHWTFMKNLTGIPQWHVQNTSEYHLSTPWVDMKMDLTQPYIHVLPKSDAIFEQCVEKRTSEEEFKMPDFKQNDVKLHKIVSTSFTPLYHQVVTDTDLMDITQHFEGPVYILIPKEHQVQIKMSVEVYDTTNKIPFFSFAYNIIFELNNFKDYIYIKYDVNGEPIEFAFHYDLRDFLFVHSLAEAESKLCIQRKGSQFEKCSLTKITGIDRLVSHATYLVPCTDGVRYRYIYDNDIHKIQYED